MLSFTISIAPRGQMRARHTAKKTKSGKVFSKTYKDEKQQDAETVLYAYLRDYVPASPIEGPIALGIRAFMPMPKKSKKWTADALAGFIRPTTKPDLDNMIKHIKDCMTTMQFWHDDNQVVEYLPGTGKYYSESPRWEIVVEGLI
jgi:Holliday junction resolvase RusA-like endonuclease